MSVGQCDRETNFGFTGCWSRTVARRPRMTLRLTPASNARASPVARAATVHWNQQADVGTHRHWRPLKPCLNFVSQRTNGSPQRWRNMASETYIVRLVRANEHATLKHLLARKAAIHYAQQHMDGADLLRCTGSARRNQHVYYQARGRPRGARTGPFTIVGLERQSDGVTLYRIKSRAHEHLAREDELKLSLARPEDE